MSKKFAVILSVICFILLLGMFVLERMHPEGGATLLKTVFNH